jgi:hypothetical protein
MCIKNRALRRRERPVPMLSMTERDERTREYTFYDTETDREQGSVFKIVVEKNSYAVKIESGLPVGISDLRRALRHVWDNELVVNAYAGSGLDERLKDMPDYHNPAEQE